MKFTDILTSSAHAYIVEGKQGETRSQFIQNFIKGLNCQNDDVNSRPCNSCASCMQIDAGTSMDVFHMQKSGKTAYKVDDVIELIDRIGMGAYGRHVIAVIDEADLLNEIQQNKLLKTLEEPEEGAIIILATSNKDNLLSTVRSRCSVVRVSDFVEITENTENAVSEIADLIMGGCRFHEYRTAIDKKVKTQEDAVELLGQMEDACRDRMLNNETDAARSIELIETARMDIYRGMSYGKALRRLFLEL